MGHSKFSKLDLTYDYKIYDNKMYIYFLTGHDIIVACNSVAIYIIIATNNAFKDNGYSNIQQIFFVAIKFLIMNQDI